MLVTQQFSIKLDGYYPILNDMHLEYGPGVHIVMGPNGVGKSTFIESFGMLCSLCLCVSLLSKWSIDLLM